jgi:FKBP-type peptidyl-prolyl cis-trans isomerase (trigger factor)
LREIQREGATRIYQVCIPASRVSAAVQDKLTSLSGSVRLPGYLPGNIPHEVLERRYGSEARAQVLKAMGAQLVEKSLPEGSIPSACELSAGASSGDVELTITATHLPDLPALELSASCWERIVPIGCDALDPDQVAAFCHQDLKTQVLDFLNEIYAFPLFPGKVEREFAAIRKSAESNGLLPESRQERETLMSQLRAIAERRLRLALVIQELARRFGVAAQPGTDLEELVMGRLLETASVQERQISALELQKLMGLSDDCS